MQNNNSYWLGAGILIAALLVIGFFFMRPGVEGKPSHNTAPTTTTGITGTSTATGTNDVNLGNGVIAHLPPGTHIEQVNTGSTKVQPPSLVGAINISPTLDPQAQTILRQKEETLITELKAAPTRVDLWLQLGVDRKIGSDYQGAADAWNYVAKVGPASLNYIAYGDLGDLYMNFVKDYPKAETNYKAAIAINPKVIDYYRALSGLYVSFYKTGTGAANAIVAEGLKANPNNPDLLQLQASLKAGQ
jgi:hypothetical protein